MRRKMYFYGTTSNSLDSKEKSSTLMRIEEYIPKIVITSRGRDFSEVILLFFKRDKTWNHSIFLYNELIFKFGE